MSADKKVNIHTDSQDIFFIVHIHSAIWKDQGLLTSKNKYIKHSVEILALLKAIQQASKVANTGDFKEGKPM